MDALRSVRHPYLATILLVALATLVGKSLLPHVAPTNHVMLYLLAVVMSSLWFGRGPTILASMLGVLAFDVFFVPPVHRLSVEDAEYLITFAALLVVALVIGTLTSRLREHADMLRTREEETAALYAFSRRMAAAGDLNDVAAAVLTHVERSFGRKACLELVDGHWVGAPVVPALRLPLRTPKGEVGSLTIATSDDEPLEPVQRRLLEAIADQTAVAVERARLAESAHKAELLMEADKLHSALLHSISHSLRTPLASIIGSLSTLTETDPSDLDAGTRSELIQTAQAEAERLNDLVGDLLDMTRLEAGHLQLLLDWYDLPDVIGAALGQAERSLAGREVTADLPADLPLVLLDQVLIVQVIVNLLNNAAKYSPPGSPIAIQVERRAGEVRIGVVDHGPGIPAAERERVFEKFHRVARAGDPPGIGLGLAICKGIVEAHRGRIWAEEAPGSGTAVRFTLPLKEAGEGHD